MPLSESEYRHKNSEDFVHMSGLIIIQEYLKNRMYDARIFDYLRYEGRTSELLDMELEDFNPDVICICGMFCIEDIHKFVIQHQLLLENSVGIAVGTGALGFDKCLEKINGIDYVIPVNPEVVILDIIKVEEERLHKDMLYGAAYTIGNDIVLKKRKLDNLDDIFQNIDVDNYISHTDKSLAYIWASRGCWYRNCTFCNIGTASSFCEGNGWQPRSIQAVVEDIQALYQIGVKEFHFLDAEFIGPGLIGKERAKEFAQYIIKSGIEINFYIDVRVDCIDRDIISELCKSGLKSVFVGIESASDNELRAIKKGYKANIIKSAINIIKEFDIRYRIGVLLAVPESTLEDIECSLDFLIENNLYHALNIIGVGSIFHELHLHLGTPIYKEYQDFVEDNDIWKGEVPCYYIKEDVRILIDYARRLQNEVFERYMLANESGVNKEFLNKYLYSLRVLSLSGLRKLIQSIKNKREVEDIFSELFRKHDVFWYERGGDFIYGSKRTTNNL